MAGLCVLRVIVVKCFLNYGWLTASRECGLWWTRLILGIKKEAAPTMEAECHALNHKLILEHDPHRVSRNSAVVISECKSEQTASCTSADQDYTS